MRTANPTLTPNTFRPEALDYSPSNVMTVNGAAAKTAVLASLLLAAAGVSWTLVAPAAGSRAIDPTYFIGFGIVAPIVGFILALITTFSPRSSPITAPLYGVAEGLFLGAISCLINARYPGIAVQAGLLTGGVLLAMMLAYVTGVVRATEKFKTGVIAATGAVAIVYLVGFVMSFFGARIPYIHESGAIGIGFSVVVIVIAALNLILDFDVVEQGVRAGAPKYMEWYAGFGLLVTLVWLYFEILRLLVKLRSSD